MKDCCGDFWIVGVERGVEEERGGSGPCRIPTQNDREVSEFGVQWSVAEEGGACKCTIDIDSTPDHCCGGDDDGEEERRVEEDKGGENQAY
ncbi:hypothetical protein QQ045_020381 [Rhodiola kirilowii]